MFFLYIQFITLYIQYLQYNTAFVLYILYNTVNRTSCRRHTPTNNILVLIPIRTYYNCSAHMMSVRRSKYYGSLRKYNLGYEILFHGHHAVKGYESLTYLRAEFEGNVLLSF